VRVAVEYIQDTAKILVRLLTEQADTLLSLPESPVQVGRYLVDAFPQIQFQAKFDIDAEQIVDGEAKVYFTGWYPLPESVTVTFPDLTKFDTSLKQVRQEYRNEEKLAEQKTETIEKPDAVEYPAHSLYKPDEMKQPDLPPFWFDLNFAKANPLSFGTGLSGSLLSYQGGVAGRALDSKILQSAVNAAPYKVNATTRLEGGYTNVLPNSDFALTYIPPSQLDLFPQGWNITLSDPDNLIRTKVNPDDTVKIPHVEVHWYPRPGFVDFSNQAPVTISTEVVPAFHTFQVIAIPARTNSPGTIQLKSATGLALSPVYTLSGPIVLRLNVGVDAGSVKILWNQTSPKADEQYVTLFGAMASQYQSPHSYIPTNAVNTADLLTVSGFGGSKFQFGEAYLRIESEQEVVGQPFSWALKFTGGGFLLRVDGGFLDSSYSSDPAFDLTPYLSSDITTAGNYKIKWSSGQPLKLYKKIPNQPETESVLPMTFDLPISDSFLNGTMDLEIRSYSPTSGSSRLKYFVLKPKDKPQ